MPLELRLHLGVREDDELVGELVDGETGEGTVDVRLLTALGWVVRDQDISHAPSVAARRVWPRMVDMRPANPRFTARLGEAG